MEMTLHRPGPHLSDCVAAMVHFAGFQPDFQRERLLPDGVIEIVVDLSDRPKRLFRSEVDPDGDDFRQAWISGVHGQPIIIEAQPMAEMLVIAFTPGGALPFSGSSAVWLLAQSPTGPTWPAPRAISTSPISATNSPPSPA